MRVAPFIALRYLFAKKSHNVINLISAISAIGMAIGTAALIIILSVYNGFDTLIRSMMGSVEPDLLITPATGKTFTPQGEAYDWIAEQESVLNMCCVLEEDVFINYADKQSLAKAKGVDWVYEAESPLRDYMIKGTFSLHRGDVPLACVGAELASNLGLEPHFLTPVEIYFPSRTRKISTSNPAASLERIKVWPSGVFNAGTDINKELIIIPIDKMRELLEYDSEVSAVEIRLKEGTSENSLKSLQSDIEGRLGPGFKVKDRFQQNESLYSMMKYEKIAIYMILIFVIIIIAFNIFGSLSMLIIEKKTDISTLRHLGTPERTIRQIFVLEGWLISLTGLAAGLIIGLGFALLQEQLGIIKMPGHFIVQAYPIVISWIDVLLVTGGVAVVGYLIALLPVSILSKRR
ncbi:MAG: ABC transporter permease [Bacteroidales bacterium]|nr:ABC transporter permease [Bacteroidales bacterium]